MFFLFTNQQGDMSMSVESLQCSSGKVGYSSQKSVQKELQRLDSIDFTSYKCHECGKHHVTHRANHPSQAPATKSNGQANRAAAHLEALETKSPASSLKIELPDLDVRTIKVKIVGDSSLIVHKWSEKAKRLMLDKQTGKASAGREHKDPQQDFQESLYQMPDGGFGVPSLAFKNAAVTACTSLGKSITKVAARQSFHVLGPLVRINGTPTMRDDMVRVGMGTADIRFRGEFKEWSCELTIRYNARVLSAEQIVNLMNTAGFAVGICEWRPECNGESGMFHVE